MDTNMVILVFGSISVLLVIVVALSMRIQRIRLLKLNVQLRHDLGKLEHNVDDFKKMLPDLVDREKLALEKQSLMREISAVGSRVNQEERKFAQLGRAIESDKKSDRLMVRSVAKLEKMVEKLKKKLAPKVKKPAKVKKAKKPAKKR
jgi:biopolymer transport protein ExbB/TolQ